MRIREYKVIRRTTLITFEAAIRDALRVGWQPLGGASVYMQPATKVKGAIPTEVYHQTMVTYESEDR